MSSFFPQYGSWDSLEKAASARLPDRDQPAEPARPQYEPGKLQPGDQVWVMDDCGSAGWPGHVAQVFADSVVVHYGGASEAFRRQDGVRGTRWLLTGPVICRGCGKTLMPCPPGNPLPGVWVDPDGITQCMKTAGLLPVPPAARVMHTPMPRITEAKAT
jgi:hypothetical protein